METLLHDMESSTETENHLKDNGEKFNRQCVMVLAILYRGGRYTGKQISEMLNIACGDRRLRNIWAARKDCKREWVYTSDGRKTRWKEYWLDIPGLPTKNELIERANKTIEAIKAVGQKQIKKSPIPVNNSLFSNI